MDSSSVDPSKKYQCREITNQYGFLQMVDQQGVAVCCTCLGSVKPNRGQGMICETCEATFAKDMALESQETQESITAGTSAEPTEEFQYREITNQYGFPQIVDQQDIPVCSSCHACVRPNRGHGMICDTCDHDAFMHMSHDYD